MFFKHKSGNGDDGENKYLSRTKKTATTIEIKNHLEEKAATMAEIKNILRKNDDDGGDVFNFFLSSSFFSLALVLCS